MTSNKRKVVSDSIFLTVGEFLLKLKGVVFLPIIITAVGMENYGVFVQVLINPAFIIPFCSFALGMGFYRYTSKYKDTDTYELGRDFWSVMVFSLFTSLVGAALLYFLSPVISSHILDGLGEDSLRLSALIIITGVLWEALTKYIQARKWFKFFTVYRLVYGLLPYLGFVVGVSIWREVYIGMVLYISINSVLIITLFVIVARGVQFVAPSLSTLRKFVKYSWALVISSVEGGMLSKVDRYFVGYFLGPAAIGVYNIVYAAASLLSGFATPFQKYVATYLPEMWDKGKIEKVKSQLREWLLYFIILSLGSLAIASVYLKPAIVIILGKDLSGISHFELLVFITGLGILSQGASEFFYQIIRNREKNHYQLLFQGAGVIVNVVLNLLLIPSMGLIGAGIATFGSYFTILAMCNHWFSFDLTGTFYSKLARVVVAGIPIYILYKLYEVHSLIELLVSLALGALVYGVLVLVFRVITIDYLKRIFA